MGRFNPGDEAIINGQIVTIVSWPSNDGVNGEFAEWRLNIAGGGVSSFTQHASIVNAIPFNTANPAATVAALEQETSTNVAVQTQPSADGQTS